MTVAQQLDWQLKFSYPSRILAPLGAALQLSIA